MERFHVFVKSKYKEFPDITIPENTYNVQYSVSTTNILLNTNSDLNGIGIILTMTKKYDPNIIKLDIGEIKAVQSGGSSDPDDNTWEQVGEKYKEVKDDLKDAIDKDVKRISVDTFLLGAIIATVLAYIMDVNIDEVFNSLIRLSNYFTRNFHEIFI
ncbi:hypothetical protein [uncultured Methanobrevibacter sp.]|uniref:hypothetical protein n=1 Tax=uncultured Methanobrevibacter sp. TaxID=253161 RepID=UPI0025D87E65|nr:hypothetical protein [uncultured Methanobrevibacter sp.]